MARKPNIHYAKVERDEHAARGDCDPRSRRSPHLRSPGGRMVGGEIPTARAECALQFDRVTLRERDHGLQPERRRLGGRRPGNLAP